METRDDADARAATTVRRAPWQAVALEVTASVLAFGAVVMLVGAYVGGAPALVSAMAVTALAALAPFSIMRLFPFEGTEAAHEMGGELAGKAKQGASRVAQTAAVVGSGGSAAQPPPLRRDAAWPPRLARRRVPVNARLPPLPRRTMPRWRGLSPEHSILR